MDNSFIIKKETAEAIANVIRQGLDSQNSSKPISGNEFPTKIQESQTYQYNLGYSKGQAGPPSETTWVTLGDGDSWTGGYIGFFTKNASGKLIWKEESGGQDRMTFSVGNVLLYLPVYLYGIWSVEPPYQARQINDYIYMIYKEGDVDLS